MKENNELEKEDLRVDANMDVDYETGTITAYIEAWFDVDKKFGTHVLGDDDMWLNLYADYSPSNGSLKMFYQVETDKNSEFFDYEPTAGETQLVKDLIAERIMETHSQTPEGFCKDFSEDALTMGGIV